MFSVLVKLVRAALFLSLFCLNTLTEARDFRRDMLPNARLLPGSRSRGCIACHLNSNPSVASENTARNAFGMDIEKLVTPETPLSNRTFQPEPGAAIPARSV